MPKPPGEKPGPVLCVKDTARPTQTALQGWAGRREAPFSWASGPGRSPEADGPHVKGLDWKVLGACPSLTWEGFVPLGTWPLCRRL